jgi:hypothetical protein
VQIRPANYHYGLGCICINCNNDIRFNFHIKKLSLASCTFLFRVLNQRQQLKHAPTQRGQNNFGVIANPPIIDLTNDLDTKRDRYTFRDSQLEKLEESFQSQRHPCPSRREALVQKLGFGCTEKNVKSWFQNRRVKAKRTGN